MRKAKMTEYKGEKVEVRKLAAEHGVSMPTLNYRMNVRGNTLLQALGIDEPLERKPRGGDFQRAHSLSRVPASERDRIYVCWRGMWERCNNEKTPNYKYYVNISVCDEWRDFSVYKKWALENGYTNELECDRKDGDKGYNPENCRWVTHQTNLLNRSCKYMLTYNGHKMTMNNVCKILDLSYNSCYKLIKEGATVEQALGLAEVPFVRPERTGKVGRPRIPVGQKRNKRHTLNLTTAEQEYLLNAGGSVTMRSAMRAEYLSNGETGNLFL